MEWRKLQPPFAGFESEAGEYFIRHNVNAHSALFCFYVFGPRSAPHGRARVGGCNDLAQAKQMAAEHKAAALLRD